MSVVIHRRSFLERLGLGVGAALFSPIAQTLVQEAHGQVAPRKIWGLYMWDHGWLYPNYTPQGGVERPGRKAPPVVSTISGLPAALAPLDKYRNKMLFLDGLTGEGYHSGSDHSLFHAALSCVKGQRTDRPGGFAGGQTIDSYVAGKIGKSTRFDALRCGLNDTIGQTFDANTFAEGPSRSIQHHVNAKAFFEHVFADFKTQGAPDDPAQAQKAGMKRRVILDLARQDVKKLRAALAGTEAAKLDKYLAIIDEFETRQSTVSTVSCKVPMDPNGAPVTSSRRPINAEFESMAGVLTVAVACGLTNVFALTVGTGHGYHGFPVWESGTASGHGNFANAQRGALVFSSQQLVKMFDAFSSIRVGDKTLFDNMAFHMFSDNAEAHHTVSRGKWPTLIIGDAGGALKTGGRMVSYAEYSKPMASLLLTTANAVGAPLERWGNANAPVAELVP
jgi:hypothetical protein